MSRETGATAKTGTRKGRGNFLSRLFRMMGDDVELRLFRRTCVCANAAGRKRGESVAQRLCNRYERIGYCCFNGCDFDALLRRVMC